MKMSDLVRSLVDGGATPEMILASVLEAEKDNSPDDLKAAMCYYNDAAERAGWSKCKALNPTRRSQLKGRLKDAGGLAGWQDAIDRAGRSQFLTERWLPGFDFFLQPSSFQKLIEGFYDQQQSRSSNKPAPMDAFSVAIGGLASRRQSQCDLQPPATPPPAIAGRKTLFG